MKIGIITAMPEETNAILRGLGDIKKISIAGIIAKNAQFLGHNLLIVEAGIGFTNATTAATLLVKECHPDIIVSAGFCGGISKDLQVGDAVLAKCLTVVSKNAVNEVPHTFSAVYRDFVSHQAGEGNRVFAGSFVSSANIMQKKQLAALLPLDVPFPVVEMESGAIEKVATEHGIPFVGLRTVSDPFDEELGFSLEEFCDDRMRIRIPKVLLTIALKPGIIPQLIRLARNSRIAASSLSQIVERFLAIL